jgi:hypothetical protein
MCRYSPMHGGTRVAERAHMRAPSLSNKRDTRNTHTRGCLRRVYVRSSTRAHRACMPFIKDECRRVSTYCVMVGTETRKRERERETGERARAGTQFVRTQGTGRERCTVWAVGLWRRREKASKARAAFAGHGALCSAFGNHTHNQVHRHTHTSDSVTRPRPRPRPPRYVSGCDLRRCVRILGGFNK